MTNASFAHQWVRDTGLTSADISGATGSAYTLASADTGNQIKVRVTFTDDAGNQGSTTSAPVHIQTPQPLYGAFDPDTLPESHDGDAAFTFEIYFSKEPGLSYTAVPDHVLDVTNGDMTSASRKVSGDNTRWVITVEPDGDADVTIALPATTDCDDPGAVCTARGQMLSNLVATIVAGPQPPREPEDNQNPTPSNPLRLPPASRAR